RESVRAERRGRQSVFVEEVDDWEISPAIADGDGMGHGGAAHDDPVALDLCLGPNELLIGAGNREALQLAAAAFQSRADRIESDRHFVPVGFHAPVGWN